MQAARVSKKALDANEASKSAICYYFKNDILMRKWRPPSAPADQVWSVVLQVVVPKLYRTDILQIAHATPLSGHLGVNKT